MDRAGQHVGGPYAPTSELGLHLGVCDRYDAGAVVRSHAPMATAVGTVLDLLSSPESSRRRVTPRVPSSYRLISASDVKRQRGWTEGLLVALLGAPDAHGPNPHGFRAPMRFFREDRVLAAESEPAFARRLEQLGERQRWRRGQPTRTHAPGDVAHLEWLDDPRLLALFHAPRRPRRPRRRPTPAAPAAPGLRFEVLRLF